MSSPAPEEFNARMIELRAPDMLAILRKFAVALDMSDPESDNFADSGADVLQHMLENAGPDLMSLLLDLDEALNGTGPLA